MPPDLLAEAAVTLARLFYRELDVRLVLQDAGADVGDLPPFAGETPKNYWCNCLNLLSEGVIPPTKLSHLPLPDGLLSVLHAALKRFPSNRDLPVLIARWEERLADAGPSAALKVLFLAANPVDSVLLRIGLEHRTIKQCLPAHATFRDHLALAPESLLEVLRRERPAVVHFAGHGEEGGQIVLEGPGGRGVLLSAAALGDAFRAVNYPLTSRPIRCVVFNACHSDQAALALSASVDVVIGTKDEIADNAALAFVKEFYGALADGRPVANAVELGQAQMRIAAEADGVRSSHNAARARSYDPGLISVHAMKGVNLDTLVLSAAAR